MDILDEAVKEVFTDIPPPARFSDADVMVIAKYRDKLLSLTEHLVKGFYDVLFSHPTTAAVFKEGERPAREKTLRDWWVRTVNGPFNENYWRWQAYVAVVHFRRGVRNSMMLGMWGWVINEVLRLLANELSSTELLSVSSALIRLGFTASSLTVTGYEKLLMRFIDPDILRTLLSVSAEEVSRPLI